MSAYAVSARGLVSRRIPQGVLAPMNALLFNAGQQGAWYDPSDLSTLFQDSAGTTPVTAMEQPVGRMLDLSGNGNHAFQATTTKRGVVSRRVNLLLGSTTLATQSITTLAAAYKLVFSGTGSVTLSGTAAGVYGAGTNSITCTAGSLTLTVSGAVQDASFHLAIDSHLVYQGVNTATDYDADPFKFPTYLRADGVDDSMQSINNIDLSYTNQVTAVAGAMRTPGSVSGWIYAHTQASPLAINALYCNHFGTDQFQSSGPASNAYATSPAYSGSQILTGIGDIKNNSAILRRNGAQVATAVTAPNASNYGTAPIRLLHAYGDVRYFSGRFYGLIVAGANYPLAQIEAGELYIKRKMKLP